ncbi:hypothetical protein LCL95_02570 [Bacillus timonensis]|nr:hypothetical protein [Bacillus timonensis]
MQSLQDALYNWLTIKVVAEARPDDQAAQETYELFTEILTEEHTIKEVNVSKDDVMYYVSYEKDNETKKARFPIELIDVMHDQMEQEPEKFQNYPSEKTER